MSRARRPPYARRLIEQQAPREVDAIDGLPPAVALQHTHRALVGRPCHHGVQFAADALFAGRRLSARRRADVRGRLFAEHAGRRLSDLPRLGRVLEVGEASLVPDPTRSAPGSRNAPWLRQVVGGRPRPGGMRS